MLSHATDQDGRPLTVLRAPEPSPIVEVLTPQDVMYNFLRDLKDIGYFPTDGSPITYGRTASYTNYVVTNDVVLVPGVYRGRKVVQIDVDALTIAGGAMQCITQQVPAPEKK
ncbi:MAG: agmatine deiminase family protein [Cytophagales bacterium]|nr:agmatine deiminase family protein [Cytophagales bacterium]